MNASNRNNFYKRDIPDKIILNPPENFPEIRCVNFDYKEEGLIIRR